MRFPYSCDVCGASNCKLWRDYASFTNIPVLCAVHAAADQGKDISGIDDHGAYPSSYAWARGELTDQIGWFVPLVPDADDPEIVWSYSSVGPAQVRAWNAWYALPTLPTEEPCTAPEA